MYTYTHNVWLCVSIHSLIFDMMKNDDDHMFMVLRSSWVTFVTFSDAITCNLYFRPWIEPKKWNWLEDFELGLKIPIEPKVGI